MKKNMPGVLMPVLLVLVLMLLCGPVGAQEPESDYPRDRPEGSNPKLSVGVGVVVDVGSGPVTVWLETAKEIDPQAETTGSGSLMVPAISFISSGNRREYSIYKGDLEGGGDARAGSPHNFYAPVNLPDKATVTSIEMRCYDGKGKGAIVLKLIRRPMYNGDYITEREEMALLKSLTRKTNYYDVVGTKQIRHGKIDNRQYGYYLEASFTDFYKFAHLRLAMVKINFTFPK